MPVMRLRVVCGRGETIESFWPTRRLRSVDFPALGRPINDTKPARPLTGPMSVGAGPTGDVAAMPRLLTLVAPHAARVAARRAGRSTVEPEADGVPPTGSGAHARASGAPLPGRDRRNRSDAARHA